MSCVINSFQQKVPCMAALPNAARMWPHLRNQCDAVCLVLAAFALAPPFGIQSSMAVRWFLILLAIAFALPALAADVVFPTGSRIGIAPPPGMAVSRNFFGFEDADNKVAIIILVLPPEAYAEIEPTTNAEPLKQQGVTLEKRELMTLPLGKAVLAIGRQELERIKLRKWIMVAAGSDMTAVVTAQIPDDARGKYTDEIVRTALTSVALRATVPVDEQLALLPFKVNELAGFRIGGLLPGRALMLTDAPAEPAAAARVDP